MIIDLSTPLKIDIANISGKVQSFIPYRENQSFPLLSGEKVSFELNSSEAALYYERQATKSLFVSANNVGASNVVFGAYNASTETFTVGSSYNAILTKKTESVEESVKTETFKYSIIGTLPYTAAQPVIGMAAGAQFAAHLSNSAITSKSDLPSGTICTATVTPGTSFTYTKSAFEDDGSLISVQNILATGNIVTISVKWSATLICIYIFEFKDAKLGAEGEAAPTLKDIEIKLPQKVLLTNLANRTISFIPFKENFTVEIETGDSIELTAITVEEVLYYLLQANNELGITL